MKRSVLVVCCVLAVILGFVWREAKADDSVLVVQKLPPPDRSGGKPLMQVLNDRQSHRLFRKDPIPEQILGDMLWAGFGVNRTGGGRTAPTAHNTQDIEIYVLKSDGIWLYDALEHSLRRISKADGRMILAEKQTFVASAPIAFVYVADKLKNTDEEPIAPYTPYMHVGSIYQNVALYCASVGLGDVTRTSFDYNVMSKTLNLPKSKFIIISQTIGFISEE